MKFEFRNFCITVLTILPGIPVLSYAQSKKNTTPFPSINIKTCSQETLHAVKDDNVPPVNVPVIKSTYMLLPETLLNAQS